MIRNCSDLRKIKGLTEEQVKALNDYILGAVSVWIRLKNKDPFFAKDFIPNNWDDTPLDALKQIHKHKSEGDAYLRAGIDFGWVLKSALESDYRTFTEHATNPKTYAFTG